MQLMQFSQQLQHRVPIVSCGLVNLNWPFLHSVSLSMQSNMLRLENCQNGHVMMVYSTLQLIASCTTYLVILIQFDSKDKITGHDFHN